MFIPDVKCKISKTNAPQVNIVASMFNINISINADTQLIIAATNPIIPTTNVATGDNTQRPRIAVARPTVATVILN